MDRKKVAGLFIIGIMVLSSLAFVVIDFTKSSGTSLKYGRFKFYSANNQYNVKINGKLHTFAFFPEDIEYAQLPDKAKNLLNAEVLTITYDANSSIASNLAEAQYYFEYQLSEIKAIERAAMSEAGTLPVRTCADATESQPVIELKQAEKSDITVNENCITVNFLDAYDLYQQTERIAYFVLGVMP